MLRTMEAQHAMRTQYAQGGVPHYDGVLLIGRDPERRKLFRYAFEGAGHTVHETAQLRAGALHAAREIAAVVALIGAQADASELLVSVARRIGPWRLPLLAIAEETDAVELPAHLCAHEVVRADSPPRDIVIRLRRLLDEAQVVEIGPVRLDVRSREVRCAGRRCALSPREFEILRVLMVNADEALSRTQIQRLVWGESECGVRAIDVSVQRIRAALGKEGSALIETLRLIGYRFTRPSR